jgi:hypothetical protein
MFLPINWSFSDGPEFETDSLDAILVAFDDTEDNAEDHPNDAEE